MAKILVVDDEQSMREFLEIMLTKEGYEVITATGGEEAIDLCRKETYDLVLTDIKMPKVNGFAVLKEVVSKIPVIMITAFGSLESAIDSMKKGAYDYITKPFNVEEIKLVIKKALEKSGLERENVILKAQLKDKNQYGDIVGASPEMVRIFDLIPRLADTKTNILIMGESGTGKELVARAVHYNSARKDKPFITINCGGVQETLLESELFGHKKGSFTGALYNKIGLFEAAMGGSIFLDEVGDLPLSTQVKLLRVVQEKSFKPLGETKEIHVDVRIISATNRNLEEEVIAGNFREDLFYRIAVIPIKIPPLRERREDIKILANHFLEKYCKELEKDIKRISRYALEELMNYNFPGNVRELENIIERSVALETSNIILPESLTLSLAKRGHSKQETVPQQIPAHGLNLDDEIGKVEKDLILSALAKAKGVRKKAAELLNISFRSMLYRLEKHGIGKEDIDFNNEK
ncbi:MAG: sigma-54 dependent transcriptional regulator [Thermodesulfobacteriota bacterium]|nr:sigma-54 dependent transcriptional regulator [Thermodesulfobacteriota bacterium]